MLFCCFDPGSIGGVFAAVLCLVYIFAISQAKNVLAHHRLCPTFQELLNICFVAIELKIEIDCFGGSYGIRGCFVDIMFQSGMRRYLPPIGVLAAANFDFVLI